ncbi:MAG: adenine nucleotide alpha hydrolase family protein [bacterium]|nr:adenine nucleotide alpha hydrolase family protein [bacterium]
MSEQVNLCCCGKPGKVYLRHAGRWFCEQCYEQYVLVRVKKYLRQHKLYNKRLRALLALSGGKDSAVLLYVLKKLYRNNIYIITLYIDEGIEGYSSRMRSLARQYAEQYSDQHIEQRFRDWIGMDFPAALEKIRKKVHVLSPCSFCTVIKRRIMDEIARREAVDVLFTGHNLTDFVVSALINLFSGNYKRLVRLLVRQETNLFPPRHWPLLYLTAVELQEYARLHGIDTSYGTCPLKTGIRKYLEHVLAELEQHSPTVQHNVFSVLQKLSAQLQVQHAEIYTCKYCGWITSSKDRVCSFCKLKRLLEQ